MARQNGIIKLKKGHAKAISAIRGWAWLGRRGGVEASRIADPRFNTRKTERNLVIVARAGRAFACCHRSDNRLVSRLTQAMIKMSSRSS
jgi:hypothetical protein